MNPNDDDLASYFYHIQQQIEMLQKTTVITSIRKSLH